MARWYEDDLNARHVAALRSSVSDGGRVFIFLGAGLSFGSARVGGRARFDQEYWGPDPGGPGYRKKDWDRWGPPPYPPYAEFATDDDGLPFPSWPWLISRMHRRLSEVSHEDDLEALAKFFRDEGALDCAQLFRQIVGDANYREFLEAQFDHRRHPFVQTTPSHEALVALSLPVVFTTNYDELIEQAHLDAGVTLRVSATEDEFKARMAEKPARHLVKLHGSIDRPDTIVLTRNDYASARSARREMLGLLRHDLANTTFLFVGFSLSDPNFNMIHDDIRESLGMLTPVSYTVQGWRDRVKEQYLTSLGVNTLWLDGWNDLPDFLRRVNPSEPSQPS